MNDYSLEIDPEKPTVVIGYYADALMDVDTLT